MAIRTSRSSARALSPNHHALARQFVTLDNFYDSRRAIEHRLDLVHRGARARPAREDRAGELCRPRPGL